MPWCLSVRVTYSESVATDPHHDVNTNEYVVESVNYDAINPREQQRLAFKLLHAHKHRKIHTDTDTTTLYTQIFIYSFKMYIVSIHF